MFSPQRDTFKKWTLQTKKKKRERKNRGTKRERKLNSVHEDRGDEDRRRASGQTRGGGEVAGLEDVGDYCAATLTPSVPGAAGIKSNRRTRPLSLAVQPLNYRRLDPDPKITIDIVASHPNMTSQESIGSCSLDVDQSASDRSGSLSSTDPAKFTRHFYRIFCTFPEHVQRFSRIVDIFHRCSFCHPMDKYFYFSCCG